MSCIFTEGIEHVFQVSGGVFLLHLLFSFSLIFAFLELSELLFDLCDFVLQLLSLFLLLLELTFQRLQICSVSQQLLDEKILALTEQHEEDVKKLNG
jgi:hypothetical protein